MRLVTAEVDKGLRERFAAAAEARKHTADSVESGRRFVAAYVEFMHYAERLLNAASPAAHAEHAQHAAPVEHAP